MTVCHLCDDEEVEEEEEDAVVEVEAFCYLYIHCSCRSICHFHQTLGKMYFLNHTSVWPLDIHFHSSRQLTLLRNNKRKIKLLRDNSD